MSIDFMRVLLMPSECGSKNCISNAMVSALMVWLLATATRPSVVTRRIANAEAYLAPLECGMLVDVTGGG